MKLFDLIVQSANMALKFQADNGSMPFGHNGPYIDSETPVRNTSHWLITFSKCFNITNDLKYKEAVIKASKYLTSVEARPMGATFWHRKNPSKDFSNGLVGQAWTIEALVEASKCLGDDKFLNTAIELFNLHPFDKNANGWMIVNVDGSNYQLDGTYNHQLWFAAAGALIYKYAAEKINDSLYSYLIKLDKHTSIYSDGCIKHLSISALSESKAKTIKKFIKQNFKKPSKDYMRMKSVGYHGFNIYAFALINQSFPKLEFWNSSKFNSIKSVSVSEKFMAEVAASSYGYPYNPPGIEHSYGIQTFYNDKENIIRKWLNEQFSRTYNLESKMMNLGDSKDPVTSAARIYEATRLKNYEIK